MKGLYNYIVILMLLMLSVPLYATENTEDEDSIKLLLPDTHMKIGSEHWYFTSWYYADGYVANAENAQIAIHPALPSDRISVNLRSKKKKQILNDSDILDIGVGMDKENLSGYAVRIKQDAEHSVMSLVQYEDSAVTVLSEKDLFSLSRKKCKIKVSLKGTKLTAKISSGLHRKTISTDICKKNNLYHDYMIIYKGHAPSSFIIKDNISTE